MSTTHCAAHLIEEGGGGLLHGVARIVDVALLLLQLFLRRMWGCVGGGVVCVLVGEEGGRGVLVVKGG
jgi:hypothetical protein